MTPRIERDLVAHLQHFEGFVAHPYYCSAGKLTIGYGHRIEDPKHQDITENQALGLLKNDINIYSRMAVALSPLIVSQPVKRLWALTDFCFNCGGHNYEGSTLRKKVNAGQWAEAATEMRKWVFITDPKTHKKNKSAWQVARREVCAEWLEAK